jgi:hypothetical protein
MSSDLPSLSHSEIARLQPRLKAQENDEWRNCVRCLEIDAPKKAQKKR